jgi:NTE family protein
MKAVPAPAHLRQFVETLHTIFGEFDEEFLGVLEPLLEWVEIAGGETLFRQGDEGDTLYFVQSGRLRASVTNDDGQSVVLGDISRGETVGEMAVFTGEPRMATVVAIRDSVLVKLTKAAFEQVLMAYPLVSMNVTRLIIERLRRSQVPKKTAAKPLSLCILPLSSRIDPLEFSRNLLPGLTRNGPTQVLDAATVEEALQRPGIAQVGKRDAQAYLQLTQWLDAQEQAHRFLLYLPDSGPTEWTQRCIRQADEILLVAYADEAPHLTDPERQLLSDEHRPGAAQTLVLLHTEPGRMPEHTARWLTPRPLRRHVHLRTYHQPDYARLARILSGTAIGLVLAGGGAKGYAHLGVLKALREKGIPIDLVGGTSVGAMMAFFAAFDVDSDVAIAQTRKRAHYNATKDYTLPLISLTRGERINQVILDTFHETFGHHNAHLEDAWLDYFVVSSNYSQARMEVHDRGLLFKYMRASVSIPGAFPPVKDGHDLLIDGGTFNNFPTDVMSRRGAGRIIGVDLSLDKNHHLDFDEIPSPWQLARDRFRGRRKKYRLPSLMSLLLNTTMLYSIARRKEARRYVDLFFNPNVSRFGLMEWKAYDRIVETGYQYAKEILDGLPEEELAKFRE